MRDSTLLDVAIVGAGVGGLAYLHYARRAGLAARVFDRQGGVGGLWRQLPAWQDIQISAADWTLGDLPLDGTAQPQILANIEAWVPRFGLADGLTLNTAVKARHEDGLWQLDTSQGRWQARHLVAATGAHNVPSVPPVRRSETTLRELHSSELRTPEELSGRAVAIVGGGASALDLLELAVAHGASRIHWIWRNVRWFAPTGKPKAVAGSVRPFARLQMSGMTPHQQSAAIGVDLAARYDKFGLEAIRPEQPFDVLQHQLIPGRHRMLAAFGSLRLHRAGIESILHDQVTLTDGTRLSADVLLWATGYALDLRWIEHPALLRLRTVQELMARCGGVIRSLDLPNLYFTGVGLDGIGSAPWHHAILGRTFASHVRGTATLDTAPTGRLNHFDLVNHLAPRDPASYPPGWQSLYRSLAMDTADDEPYPMPA